MIYLTAKDVSLTLKKREILTDVSLHLTGGLVGLIGPNGAGKSSLLRVLAGLWRPTAGIVSLDGRTIFSISGPRRARTLAFLPPERDVIWPLPVTRVVSLGRYPHRGPFAPWSARDDAAVAAALEAVDVVHLKDRLISEISNGERARVLLARALAVDAPVLLIDEAIAALDPAHQLQVMDVLRNETEKGRVVLAVLHDLSLAQRYCDTLVLMHEGRIHDRGTPGEVLTADNLREVYGIEADIGMAQGQPFVIPARRLIEIPTDPESN